MSSIKTNLKDGGRDVLDAIGQTCAGCDLTASRQVLRECGNMSSPSVLWGVHPIVRVAQRSQSPHDKKCIHPIFFTRLSARD
jgi:predicted naringenin-chalcone synthase